MSNINEIIGRNLLLLRKYKKLTQMEVAEKFNYSDKSISKWENGESLPSIDVLYEICNFYNITLNDLLTENYKIDENKSTQQQRDKMLPTKMAITLLAVSAVWFLATALFTSLKIVFDNFYPNLFLYAIPVSLIVLLVFNSVWGKSVFLPAILTCFIWTTLLCVHMTLIEYNIWIIYILGIPLQVAVILWGTLLNNPNSKKKTIKKEKTKKPKKDNENDVKIENANSVEENSAVDTKSEN